MTPNRLMDAAIDAAQRGIAAGQTPFGCAIWLGDRLVAACHNTVWLTTDITAHAEVNALREACRHTGNVHLSGALVATTCEPCPMCMAALHWADVAEVYHGASIADAANSGFRELMIPANQILQQGKSGVKLQQIARKDCADLFLQWQRSGGKSY